MYTANKREEFRVKLELANSSTVDTIMIAKKRVSKNTITEVVVDGDKVKELLVSEKNGWLVVKNIERKVKYKKFEKINKEDFFKDDPVVEKEEVKKEVEPKEVTEDVEPSTDLEQKAEKVAQETIELYKDEERVQCPYCDKDYAHSTAARFLAKHLVEDHADKL